MSTASAAPATATVAAPAPALASPAADLPAFSFWGGPDPVPLPQRFARIKRNLIAGHEAELKASWARLVHALRAEVEHIEGLGPHLIPSIEFADLDDPAQTARFGRDLRRYGVGVVRKTLPRPDADAAVRETVRYLDKRRPPPAAAAAGDRWTGPDGGGGGPTRLRAPKQDPTCFDCFWTPAQVLSRAHLNVLRAQGFMMSLWETGADDRLVTRLPITYVDRIRVEGGGFDAAAVPSGSAPGTDLASPDHGRAAPSPWPCQRGPPPPAAASLSSPPSPPESESSESSESGSPPPGLLLAGRSADDWITALQSSAGVIAQVDNGSLERWEPDGYGRGGTYDRIFHGNWEQYDPWECASRVSATIDLYNGYGSCSIFRMFQGLLALSTIEPGMLRLLPSPKLTTAYYLLRPFFSPRLPAPAARSGPAWEAYLSSDNWELQADPDTIIHGAVPGHSQRLRERWHPHLHLRSSLVTLPTLQPGDYILWHPDLPYHFNNTASRHQPPPQQHHQHHHYHHHYHCHHQPSPDRHAPAPAPDDVRMIIYVSAAPLTQTNALYLARQRKAFQRGHPGPDFDTSGLGIVAEDPDRRPGEADIARVGGPPALRAMGLAPWDDGLVDAAEANVVGLANRILFPK